MSIKDKLLAFIRDEEGLTTVEYAVAGGLITAAAIAGFKALGGKVSGIITAISGALPTGLNP